MRESIVMLKWFSICFRYHPNKRQEFLDDFKKVKACIRENLDYFPKLEEMLTTPREPIAARTECGRKLIEDLYSKFKVDCRVEKRREKVSH